MNARMFNGNNLPHELLLTTRQTIKLRNAIANDMSADINLPKAQICKIIQSGGFLGRLLLDPLLKTRLPLLKSVIKPIRLLDLKAASSVIDPGAQKKIYSGSGTTILAIPNNDIQDVLNIFKSLEDSELLLKGITKTIHNNISVQRGSFL